MKPKLTKPQKKLLDELGETVYDGNFTEIFPHEVRTAMALERKKLIEINGLTARIIQYENLDI